MSGPPFLERYRWCFETTWQDDTPIDRVRFVVLDSETTGLDPRTDRIITIGAVAVEAGDLVLGDAFHSLIRVSLNTPAVTVHGVTRDASRKGSKKPLPSRRFSTICATGSSSAITSAMTSPPSTRATSAIGAFRCSTGVSIPWI